ncbi:hypothetical protein GQX74_000944 [Glossina fuscipes]|nr:hypothetical protein GQX74_000944 [Glossina fuscipes]
MKNIFTYFPKTRKAPPRPLNIELMLLTTALIIKEDIVTTLLTQSKFYNFNPYSNDTSLLDPAPIETVLNTFCSKY